MGNTKKTKGELHPCAEGSKISVRRLSLSQNDSVNKVNSKFLIKGKEKQQLFHFLINWVIQLTTSDVVMHSVLSVLLPTLPPHKIAADPVCSWWDYWRVNSWTNYETRSRALLLYDFYTETDDSGKCLFFITTGLGYLLTWGTECIKSWIQMLLFLGT